MIFVLEVTESLDYENTSKTSSGVFYLYPNPAKEILNVMHVPGTFQENHLLITDDTGNVVDRFSLNDESKKLKIDVSALKPGTYTVSWFSKSELVKSKKVTIVQKL